MITMTPRALTLDSLSRAAIFLVRPRLIVMLCAATAVAFELLTVLAR
jgi:hypothetical protein